MAAAAAAPPEIVLATRNDHKLRELAEILDGIELIALPEAVELPPEDADSFTGNALIKARAAREATGLPSIGDDSGIAAADLVRITGARSRFRDARPARVRRGRDG